MLRISTRKYALEILYKVREIFKAEPSVVDVSIPEDKHVTVCGDVHGQYYDLCNIFELNGKPSEVFAALEFSIEYFITYVYICSDSLLTCRPTPTSSMATSSTAALSVLRFLISSHFHLPCFFCVALFFECVILSEWVCLFVACVCCGCVSLRIMV